MLGGARRFVDSGPPRKEETHQRVEKFTANSSESFARAEVQAWLDFAVVKMMNSGEILSSKSGAPRVEFPWVFAARVKERSAGRPREPL